MSDELEITIDRNGRVVLRTIGIRGSRCLEYAELFAHIVGREVSRELTSDYYATPDESQNRLHVRNRRE